MTTPGRQLIAFIEEKQLVQKGWGGHRDFWEDGAEAKLDEWLRKHDLLNPLLDAREKVILELQQKIERLQQENKSMRIALAPDC